MISKISYIKLIREDIRHRGWLAALSGVLLFLSMPVYTLIYLDSYSELCRVKARKRKLRRVSLSAVARPVKERRRCKRYILFLRQTPRVSQAKGWRYKGMLEQIDQIIKVIDGAVWGLPLIILILFTGFLLTTRLGLLQIRHLGKALKFMFKNEEDGQGEVTSFGALCTALSATIGTGNITGVATALAAGGPGALFWMVIAAFFGMATKYAEGLLAIKYRTIDKDGHVRCV